MAERSGRRIVCLQHKMDEGRDWTGWNHSADSLQRLCLRHQFWLPFHTKVSRVCRASSDQTDISNSLIRDGAAIPYTAHAAPPTVTMPRVKGLTTGSVPSFVDLILNFAESDTSSSLSTQDTWLAQIRSHLHPEKGEGRLVFYGDDTWLKLFPDFFAEHDGTSSFFVSVSSFQ